MDLPQSIQVIDAEIIEQQQAIRLSEVLKNANGVYVGSARGGAQESFFLEVMICRQIICLKMVSVTMQVQFLKFRS